MWEERGSDVLSVLIMLDVLSVLGMLTPTKVQILTQQEERRELLNLLAFTSTKVQILMQQEERRYSIYLLY